ncbi:MAG: hypothetical protein Q4A64_01730 [Porphyromonadaceae bacterium]|nr:hypothetical protein [Porphyromonadaceae bacterium]
MILRIQTPDHLDLAQMQVIAKALGIDILSVDNEAEYELSQEETKAIERGLDDIASGRIYLNDEVMEEALRICMR